MAEERGSLSHEEASALLDVLEQFEKRISRLTEANRELAGRLYTVENSRLFLALRKAGVLASDYKRKAGQALLHSPLHPLFLKFADGASAEDEYALWLEQQPEPDAPVWSRKPLLSVVMPVHNPRREWLQAALESVREQRYDNWQLCVCDDASTADWVREYLAPQAASDPRISFVRSDAPLGISGALNKAASLAQGEYLGFLDHDDALSPFALESVAELSQQRDYDLIYSDEDRLDQSGRRTQPIFRPDWSPELLTACMYMGHFLVLSRKAWDLAGGFRPECDGAQDYDLALRVSEQSAAVGHIPRVLYHWRMHDGSTASTAESKPETHAAGRRALADAMTRRGRAVRILDSAIANRYQVRPVVQGRPLVSLIICSRNAALLSRCLEGIWKNTTYAHRETVIVQHKTRDNAAMDALLATLQCTRVPYAGPFHYARMNNAGAEAARGEILVFLNDDVLPLTAEWLELLVGQAQRPEIGAVGAKLVYPSGTVQHAGIVLGMMDATGHPWRGTFGSSWWPWLDCARNASAVTGACLAIRKSVFLELGGFDLDFPVNYNDVDLCLRLRERSYQVICEPGALLRHDESRTRMPGTHSEERELFLQRWAHRADPYYHPALVKDREDAGLRLE